MKTILGLIVLLPLSACVSGAPNVDNSFGMAARTAFALQVINPGAHNDSDPGIGMDAKAAVSSYARMNRPGSASPSSGQSSGGGSDVMGVGVPIGGGMSAIVPF